MQGGEGSDSSLWSAARLQTYNIDINDAKLNLRSLWSSLGFKLNSRLRLRFA